ncbi:hypothetical protein [Undibacterium umbellatum]|uniref:Uncharacterized protein n=1 Tax=Undibacterium umbellatum TaxID=2762300 RepID=A0ABR6ZI40_9BURK|nr:hypothetical protein [Undibacterium umbellatum]MBC3911397.1 hypothetical protein [Undibacterium umbellatum]
MSDRALAVIIKNSPIDFVLTGPFGGRDRVMIRTENAGIDLIASCSQSVDRVQKRFTSDPILAVFGGRKRQLNVVSSMPVPDIRRDVDERESRLNFAWVGLASTMQIEKINYLFIQNTPDIFYAIKGRDEEDVEFNIAPIVLACSEMNEIRRRNGRMLRVLTGFYAVLALGVAVVMKF